jgi:hypothetical protein
VVTVKENWLILPQNQIETTVSNGKNLIFLWLLTLAPIKAQTAEKTPEGKPLSETGSARQNYEKKPTDPEMLEANDFNQSVWDKYAKRYAQGTNAVVIDPEVAEFFSDQESINQVLRSLAEIIKRQGGLRNFSGDVVKISQTAFGKRPSRHAVPGR